MAHRGLPMLPFDASGGRMSEGRRLLNDAIANGRSQIEIARAVGCSRSLISMITTGQKVPQLWIDRKGFERELRISGEAWDNAPTVSNATRVN